MKLFVHIEGMVATAWQQPGYLADGSRRSSLEQLRTAWLRTHPSLLSLAHPSKENAPKLDL